MNYKMNLVVDEAKRILLEQPKLKHYEAIIKAKEVLKKDPQGLPSKKGQNKNTFI